MKSRRLNLSSDHRQTIVRHRTRSTTIIDGRAYSEPIPLDLIIEILVRLPVKSVAKCRCVSKRWSAILRLPHLTDLFLTRSYARPQLLFACQNRGEVIFFSSPQPQNSNENSPPLVVYRGMRIQVGAENYRMAMPWDWEYDSDSDYDYDSDYNSDSDSVYAIFSHISSGFVCIDDLVICNPSTRQSFTLPNFNTKMYAGRSFFGYDPIEKQFKVLAVGLAYGGKDNAVSSEHRVLILGTDKPSWRMIKCGVIHNPSSNGICINGVLYYKASTDSSLDHHRVICFDVRSEKFSFVSAMDTFAGAVRSKSTLVNYNGKLASLTPEKGSKIFRGANKSFEMYVLEDPEKQKWSKHVHELPSLWKDVVGENVSLQCAGMIGANEIVFSTRSASNIFYYNIERKTVTKVEIKGMEAFKGNKVHTFLDYVEDVKLLKVV